MVGKKKLRRLRRVDDTHLVPPWQTVDTPRVCLRFNLSMHRDAGSIHRCLEPWFFHGFLQASAAVPPPKMPMRMRQRYGLHPTVVSTLFWTNWERCLAART
jgi:hypothetical protein